jgi:hypothetical protein
VCGSVPTGRRDSTWAWSPATLRAISAKKVVEVKIMGEVFSESDVVCPPQAVKVNVRMDRNANNRYIFFTPKIY